MQGIRDLLATNEFRYVITRRGGTLAHGFSLGTPAVDLADFGNQGIDPNLESPDIYQYNLTLERELPGDIGLRVSYIGSTMRKLLVDRDYNTLPGEHGAVRSRGPGRSRAPSIPALRLLHGHR